jgi:hypothetical protein
VSAEARADDERAAHALATRAVVRAVVTGVADGDTLYVELDGVSHRAYSSSSTTLTAATRST